MATYDLQFQVDEAKDHDGEWFYQLQHALVRLWQLIQENPDYLVACIFYQDENGNLHDVLEYNNESGFEFSDEEIPFHVA
jgi:muconolactone delta-isomerase